MPPLMSYYFCTYNVLHPPPVTIYAISTYSMPPHFHQQCVLLSNHPSFSTVSTEFVCSLFQQALSCRSCRRLGIPAVYILCKRLQETRNPSGVYPYSRCVSMKIEIHNPEMRLHNYLHVFPSMSRNEIYKIYGNHVHAPTDIWTYLIYGHHTSARAERHTPTKTPAHTHTNSCRTAASACCASPPRASFSNSQSRESAVPGGEPLLVLFYKSCPPP